MRFGLGVMLIAGMSFGGGAGSAKPPEWPPVYFCGETVPTQEQRVARRLVKTLAAQATQNRALYRLRIRAAGFFSAIEPILEFYQIPPDFKYLPLVESALQSRAVSPKGAVGYWQLMPATARELGLVVQAGFDERRDLQKSTDAACRYLRYLHNELGSWTLVAAAYNMGIGNLLKNIRRQNETDYYYLHLNPETDHYLYRIVAFKELLTNFRAYDQFISAEAIGYLSDPLPGEERDDAKTALVSDEVVEAVIGQEGSSNRMALPNLPTTTRQRLDELHLANLSVLIHTGLRAKLVEAGSLQTGQTWVFSLTRGLDVGDLRFDKGDLLYALIEAVDSRNGKIYLRAQKIWSVKNRSLTPLAMTAVDVSTGQTGIPLPDLDALKAGWILTWKAL